MRGNILAILYFRYIFPTSIPIPQGIMAKVKWKVKFGNLKPSNSQREATEDDIMRVQTILKIKKHRHGDCLHTNM